MAWSRLSSASLRQPTSESGTAKLGRRPKKLVTQRVSQVPGFPGPMRRYSFLRQCIELAGLRVTFDGYVELIGVKGFKPGTKSRQLPGR
jgi:hypothetical protein